MTREDEALLLYGLFLIWFYRTLYPYQLLNPLVTPMPIYNIPIQYTRIIHILLLL